MSEVKELTYEDRPWPDGLWMQEPDRVQWVDEATGLVCLVKRHERNGHLCGYVAVPPSHPFHRKDYSECSNSDPCDDNWCYTHSPAAEIEVHGGLTYAASCQGDPETGICHVPAPGEPDDVWWFGFDCFHAWDLSPGMKNAAMAEIGRHDLIDHDQTYRTIGYVKDQCASMAKQLAAVAA